ncbi:hypothetical protein [Streptomyces sp. NPDC002403]
MTLVETGTRSLIGAVFGSTDEGETSCAGHLLHLLSPDMLVLWDKGFDGNAFLRAVTATGAQVLGRLRNNRRTPVLPRLADGSYLSVIGTVKVCVIDAEITVTCDDGPVFTGSYRLVTTLTDARRHPAAALTVLYHECREHESAYYALRRTILHGHVMRSNDPARIGQEMWALLSLYQALRAVMVEAAESEAGTDPDRYCFTVALQTARDQVTQLAVTVLEPGPEQPTLPAVSRDDRNAVPSRHRRHRILALLQDDPNRLWRVAEIAARFGDIRLDTMYRQLSRWADSGPIHKIGPGLYTATTWKPTALQTTADR